MILFQISSNIVDKMTDEDFQSILLDHKEMVHEATLEMIEENYDAEGTEFDFACFSFEGGDEEVCFSLKKELFGNYLKHYLTQKEEEEDYETCERINNILKKIEEYEDTNSSEDEDISESDRPE